jgi:hypothetical protein
MNYNFLSVAMRTTAAIGTLALATAGCGASPVHHGGSRPATAAGKAAHEAVLQRLTPATVEAQITVLQQRVGLSVKSVHCPGHGQILNRRTFTCVTTLASGAPIRTMVTPTNVTRGLARFQFLLPG